MPRSYPSAGLKVTITLDKSDISMLLSLVALEMGRCGEVEDRILSHRDRLADIRNKLLVALDSKEDLASSRHGDLPEFREYARIKYNPELDGDLITMFEDLIDMRRQEIGSDHQPAECSTDSIER